MNDILSRLDEALSGRYRIEREVGQGGMAIVYLAEDLRHQRRVALKVLRPELAAMVGAERFLAEIKVTAGLQHPHVLPLFDSGVADGFLFYVMPFVEGESLRDRLDKERQLPLDEAVRIATDVAEALDHAHRHGVIHRDVKPANILLQDGRPVVADFGIALAVTAAGGGRLTETGLSIGTPYYMSPEQATGDREVDARSDTYSLGCVVYEMLTGEPPFAGGSAQAVLGRILMGTVEPVTTHRKTIPPHVEAAVLRALEKLPADRFTQAIDFARALNNPAFRHPAGWVDRQSEPGARPSWRSLVPAAVAVAALAGALGWLGGRAGSEAPPVERQRVVLGTGPEDISEMVAFRVALHPRGEGIVFADTTIADGQVRTRAWWKGRSEIEAEPIPSLDGALTPTFSPDGEWILFVRDGELRRQPLTGGNSVLLASPVSGGTAHALAWLDDGTVVFENADFVLQRMEASGQAEVETISTESRTGQPIHLSGLPGSWGVLVSACVNSCPAGTMLSLVDLRADTVVKLADDIVRAWPAPDDQVVYLTRDGAVFGARLDRRSRSLGPPTPLFDGVRVSTDANGEMHIAPDGTALFVRGTASGGSFVPYRVDRSGRSLILNRTFASRSYTSVVLSADAERVALTIVGAGGEQLWVGPVGVGPLVPLTPNEASARRPAWFGDGSRLAYISGDGRPHVRAIRADGTSLAPDTLFIESGMDDDPATPRLTVYEVELTESSDTVLVRVNATSGNADVFAAQIDGETDPLPLLSSPFDEVALTLSPDDRWLAYVSDVSGRNEVYVRPFPDVSADQVPISLNGGTEPVWSPDGDELFYRDDTGWLVSAQVVTSGSSLVVAQRERLFDASGYATHGGWRGYDAFPGAQEFAMLQSAPGTEVELGELVLVENLFRQMRLR